MQPPVSPSIAAQQMPPAAAYARAQGGPGDQSIGGGDQTSAAMGLVQSLLTSVGNELEKVAKVLVTVKPELIPILKQSVNALSMLMNEAQKSMAPDQGQATQAQTVPASAAVSGGA